jgi:hypothetical protein
VSIANTGASIFAEDIPLRLLTEVCDPNSGLVDSTRLGTALRELEQFIASDDVTVFLQTELFGFDTSGPFDINDHMRIVRNIQEPSPATTALLVPQGRYCLEARRETQLTLTDLDEASPGFRGPDVVSQLFTESQTALQCLMILRPSESFTPGQAVVRYDNWVPLSSFQSRAARPVFPTGFERYHFEDTDTGELQSLVSACAFLPQSARHALVALRRFYLAKLRDGDDDRILDLMIAAEALFLNDAQGELSFRLATRAALFLADTREHRVEVYRAMRDAYDKRSQIVHGALVPAVEIRKVSRLAESYIGDAIRKAITLVGTGQQNAVNKWDEFAFLNL